LPHPAARADPNFAILSWGYSFSGGTLLGIAPAIPSGMTTNASFRELRVWQESMLLVEDIYRITRKFPREERYGLTSQLRGAAISIPSNIGEGARRKRRRVFLNHLDIALGSQGEVDVSG
jgi:hypothetical protein